MKTAALVLAFALGVSADGLGGHSHAHAPVRRGRQEEAPLDAYAQPGYEGDLDSAASDVADPLAMLQGAIPGVPGEDYPIYAEVPESGFTCEGQVDGGYYSDPEAECQAFHICTADGAGGLAKYSFLCPNGTLFNQNYFICDWWFNFDCSTAEELYSLGSVLGRRSSIVSRSISTSCREGVPLCCNLVIEGVELLGGGAVKVEPPVADEVVLVEEGSVGAEEAVLGEPTGAIRRADVERLALSLRVRVVTSVHLTVTSKS